MTSSRPDKNGDCSFDEEMIEDKQPSEIFKVLTDHHRRCLLHYFRTESADTAEIDEICSYLIEGPPDTSISEDDFRTDLRHNHLPKLTNAGIIEFDQRHEEIRYHSDPLLEMCLELVSNHDLE